MKRSFSSITGRQVNRYGRDPLTSGIDLLDLQLPLMGGVEATRKLGEARFEGAVVVLTHLSDDESLFSALKAGAIGYVLKDATPAQIALAWLLAQKPWIVPIPGTTKLERLDENIGAVALELTTDDLREIDNAAAKITVEGARYPEKLELLTGR